jgi:hypothetical protein
MDAPAKLDPSRRRRRVLIAGTTLLVIFAVAAANALAERQGAWRLVDYIRVGGLGVMATAIALRSTTSLRFTPRNPELDDELARANRASAAQTGFWALMAATALAFIFARAGLMTLTEAAPLLLVTGAVGAGLRFTFLEGRGE